MSHYLKAQVRQLSAELIPGDGWVTDHLAEDGTRTVLPLIAWHVVNGAAFPVPKPPDETWIVRPRMPADDNLISVTARSMQLKPNNPQNWSIRYEQPREAHSAQV